MCEIAGPEAGAMFPGDWEQGREDRSCFWGRRAGLAEPAPGSRQEGARRELGTSKARLGPRNSARLCLRRHQECQHMAGL